MDVFVYFHMNIWLNMGYLMMSVEHLQGFLE